MKIGLVSATKEEVIPLLERFESQENIDFIVTGAGIPATIMSLTERIMTVKYDLLINVGIAGAFKYDIQLGDVFEVVTDTFGDLGAETKDGSILTLNELGLNAATYSSDGFYNGTQSFSLPEAKAITVNQCHGESSSIVRAQRKFGAELESMEGAAFMMVCNYFKIPLYTQIRSVSNYVEPRNKLKWNIPLAVQTLNEAVEKILLQYA